MTDGKTLDDKTLKTTYEVTSEVYKDTCKVMGYSNQEVRYLWADDEISLVEADHRREKLDEKYRELLCKLPTYVLDNIIIAWESGQQRRNPKTIDNIATELLQRELDESKGCN